MSKHRFLDLLEKQLHGQTSEREDRLIEAIFDRIHCGELHWKLDVNEEEVRKSIKSKIDMELKPQQSYQSVSIVVGTMAAVFVGIVIFVFILIPGNDLDPSVQLEELVTNKRQKATLTLTDGTKVHLNVGSKLSFPDKFGSDERKVFLKGEAFFEVAPDVSRPFLVEVNGVESKVLGTSFNVNAYCDNKVEIAVVSGSVGVRENRDNLVSPEQYLVLSPKQMAVVDRINKKVSVEFIEVDHYLAWRSESITFDLLPFDKVVKRLEEVYSMEIKLDGYWEGDCLVRATYFNKSLYHVLYSLKNVADFEYELDEGRSMRIYYRGCKF